MLGHRSSYLISARFRWVFCQLAVLQHCLTASIRETLDQLPETLDETYARVLSQIPPVNQAHAHRMLQCLMVAVRPLRVEELAELLAFEFGANYLRSRLVESCYLHTLVIKADTRVYFAPVWAVIVTAPYSAFWLNTCVVYSVDLSHRSQAIPEVSYPFTLRSRTVHSCLDSFVCVSR
jgi:hypothetical protein